MPVHHLPQPLKTPLLCWHESLSSARNDALVALSTDSARIATTRPLAAGTAVYLELEGGAGIDAVATALDATGFVVEFVTVDDAAAVLIERALRDNADDRVPQPFERTVSRPAAILSPPGAPSVASEPVPEPEPLHADADAHAAHGADGGSGEEVPSFGACDVGGAATGHLAAVAVVTPATSAEVPAELVPAELSPSIEATTTTTPTPVTPAGAPFAVPASVAEPAAPTAMQQDEVSIADALRFELDDDDDAVVAPSLAPVAELRPFTEPVSPTPPPAPIVEPFDDLHSDDLVDAAFAHYQPAPTAEPDFEQAFGAPRAEQAALDAAEAAFLANDDVATDMPRTRTDALFALPAEPAPPVLPPPPASLSRTPTASLFDMPHTVPMGSLPVPAHNATQDLLLTPAALSAEAWAQAMGHALPSPPPAPPPPLAAPPVVETAPPAKETTDKWPLARAITAEHTEPPQAPPPRHAVDDDVFAPSTVPPAQVTVPDAFAMPTTSGARSFTAPDDLAVETTSGPVAIDEPEAIAASFTAPEVTAPVAFALPITSTGGVVEAPPATAATLLIDDDMPEDVIVPIVAPLASAGFAPVRAGPIETTDVVWAPIAQHTDEDDTHLDAVGTSATAPAAASAVNDVASDDLADGFDVAFTNPGAFALEPMPTAESPAFAPPPSTGEHAIELELDEDEIELDHRPNLVLEPIEDHVDHDHVEHVQHVQAAPAIAVAVSEPSASVPVAMAVVDRVPSRPLPTLDPEEPASDDSPRVVDVDFSEFRDVLGATRRVYDALLPSLLPRAPSGPIAPTPTPAPSVAPPTTPPTPPSTTPPPATTAATLGLPQPPPSLLTLPEPPRAPTAPFALPRPPGSRATAAFGPGAAGNPFGGDSERQRLADSVPPALPSDEPWTVSSPPAPAFPAPRLLDADLGPVLTAGNSSAPRGLPFVGDSGGQPAPTQTQTVATVATVSPLTPSTPDDLPLVVGDQVLLSAEDLVDDDWQLGPAPGAGRR